MCALNKNESAELSALACDGEFNVFNINTDTLESVPYIVQKFIKDQPGLRIDRRPVTSFKDLAKVYALLNRKPDRSKISKLSAPELATEIIGSFYVHVWANREGRSDEFRSWTVEGQGDHRIVSRKCKTCGARLLDDAYARYKKLDPSKYVARQIKGGCGSPRCKEKQTLAIPVDKTLEYRAGDSRQLNRRPNKTPGWSQHFVRTEDDCRKHKIPTNIETTCSKCREEGDKEGPRFTDHHALWTINKTTVYLVRKPNRCKKHKSAAFVPVDVSTLYTHTASLTKLWKKIEEGKLKFKGVISNFDHLSSPNPRISQ
jgi:hypothetical protein